MNDFWEAEYNERLREFRKQIEEYQSQDVTKMLGNTQRESIMYRPENNHSFALNSAGSMLQNSCIAGRSQQYSMEGSIYRTEAPVVELRQSQASLNGQGSEENEESAIDLLRRENARLEELASELQRQLGEVREQQQRDAEVIGELRSENLMLRQKSQQLSTSKGSSNVVVTSRYERLNPAVSAEQRVRGRETVNEEAVSMHAPKKCSMLDNSAATYVDDEI